MPIGQRRHQPGEIGSDENTDLVVHQAGQKTEKRILERTFRNGESFMEEEAGLGRKTADPEQLHQSCVRT